MSKRLCKAFGVLFLLLELLFLPLAAELMLKEHLSDLPTIEIVTMATNIGSIALCLLMSFSAMSEQDSYPLRTVLFQLIIFVCSAIPISDLIARTVDTAGRPDLNMLANTVYYMLAIGLAYLVLVYEFRLIGARNKPALIGARRLALVLTLLGELQTLLNIRFGYFFTITETGRYVSAPTYWVSYIVPVALIVIMIVTAAREMVPGKQQRAFFFFWLFALVTTILQVWRSDLSFQLTGYTLSLVVLYLNVQSELDTFSIKDSNQEEI